MARVDPEGLNLKEKVVYINRVTKVVKGGRRFRLGVLVVVGNGQGYVGIGLGKGREVPVAIKKAVEKAKKNLFEVPLRDSTIPHPVIGHFGAGKVLMRPASKGTGVIAGGAARTILELAGIKDVLAKSLGSSNAINMARATEAGLKNLRELAPPPAGLEPEKPPAEEKVKVAKKPKKSVKIPKKPGKSSASVRLRRTSADKQKSRGKKEQVDETT